MKSKDFLILALALFISSSIFCQTNPDIKQQIRDLAQKSSNLQKAATTSGKISRLYFIDKDILKLCPERDSAIECVKYMKSNNDRFGKDDEGFFITDFWLKQPILPNSDALGDYEIDRIIGEAYNIQEGFGATIAQFEPVKSKLDNWLGRYKKHPRYKDALVVSKAINKEFDWKKKKHGADEVYQP